MTTCACQRSQADETRAEDRTDRTAERIRGDQRSGEKANRGTNARSDGGRAWNPSAGTRNSTATGRTEKSANDPAHEQRSLAARIADDGAKQAAEAAEETRDEK
jgi:hypothetical protein